MAFTTAGVALTANTRYWLVLYVTQDLNPQLFWQYDEPSSGTDWLTACPILPMAFSIDEGVEWITADVDYANWFLYSIN